MGKKKITIVSEEESKKARSPTEAKKKSAKAPGLAGGQRIKDMSATAVIINEPILAEPVQETPEEKKETEIKKPPKVRGKKYLKAKALIDPTIAYPINQAIQLAKKTSYSKFGGSIEAHFKVTRKGLAGEASLPYHKAKEKKVAVFNKEVLEKIKEGKIDFEVLLASPADMASLVPFAKVLGPKGLMPNPKNGTIVPDPQSAKEKFSQPSFIYKTESDFPLIHTVIGKFDQKDEELIANFKAIVTTIGPTNIQKAVIKASIGPVIKASLTWPCLNKLATNQQLLLTKPEKITCR